MPQFRGAVDLSALSSKPSSPASGYQRLYSKTDNRLYLEDSAGAEYPVSYPGGWGSADFSLAGWTYDPIMITTGQTPSAGTIYMLGVNVVQSFTASNVYFVVTNALTGSFTAGQTMLGVLDSTGAVLTTTSITANTTAGLQTVAITPQSLTSGMYWIAFLWNGTLSGFQVARCSTTSVGAMNINRSPNLSRVAVNGTSQTSITTRTPANNTNSGAFSLWAAIGT
jgi:hypothetical protein